MSSRDQTICYLIPPDPAALGVAPDDDSRPVRPVEWPSVTFRFGQALVDLRAIIEAYRHHPEDCQTNERIRSELLVLQALRRALRTSIPDATYRCLREELKRTIIDSINIYIRFTGPTSDNPRMSIEEIPTLTRTLLTRPARLEEIVQHSFPANHPLRPFYNLGEVFRRAVRQFPEPPIASRRRSVDQQARTTLEELARIAGTVPELIRRQANSIERLARAGTPTPSQPIRILTELANGGISETGEAGQTDPGEMLEAIANTIDLELSLIQLDRSAWHILGLEVPPEVEASRRVESEKGSAPENPADGQRRLPWDDATEKRNRFIYEQYMKREPLKTIVSEVKLRAAGYDLLLMSPVEAKSDIPTVGKNLIIIANVQGTLHFRIFEADGRGAVDTDETELADKDAEITKLTQSLSRLWQAPQLSKVDKDRVRDAVTSIVGHTRAAGEGWDSFESPQRVQPIAVKYAEVHGLPAPALRKPHKKSGS